MLELSKNVRELKSILYGNSESEPVAEACAQLTQEFFRENTLRLLIKCLPKLNLEVCGMETSVFLGFPCRNYQLNSFSCFTFVVFFFYTLLRFLIDVLGGELDGSLKEIAYLGFHLKLPFEHFVCFMIVVPCSTILSLHLLLVVTCVTFCRHGKMLLK